MARVAGKLLLLQIIGFLYCSATAQYEDLENFSGDLENFSGDVPDPDYEDGDDEDFDYGIDYIPEDVDICHTYPSGIVKIKWMGGANYLRTILEDNILQKS